MSLAIAPIRSGGRSLGWDLRVQQRVSASYIRFDSIADPYFERVLVGFDELFAPDPADFGDSMGHAELSSGAAPAVAVVTGLIARLGLSQRDVLSAAGIRKRTFLDWQRNPTRQPRLASQADLWALAQSMDVIAERLGGGVERWVKADPDRLKLLRRGEHRELARIATRIESRDPADASLERRMGVGFFDEGEGSEQGKRAAGAPPIRVSAAARGQKRR